MRKTQISREGDRFEVPKDIARLSILGTMVLDDYDDRDGTDIENGIDGRRTHEIPLHLIKLLMLARIVRYLEYYKEEPSEFVMSFSMSCYSRHESFEHLFMINDCLKCKKS